MTGVTSLRPNSRLPSPQYSVLASLGRLGSWMSWSSFRVALTCTHSVNVSLRTTRPTGRPTHGDFPTRTMICSLMPLAQHVIQYLKVLRCSSILTALRAGSTRRLRAGHCQARLEQSVVRGLRNGAPRGAVVAAVINVGCGPLNMVAELAAHPDLPTANGALPVNRWLASESFSVKKPVLGGNVSVHWWPPQM